MKRLLAILIFIKSSFLMAQYTTDVQFMLDSIPLVDEKIIVRCSIDYDSPKYETIKTLITDSTGIVKINPKPGLYKFYWSRYGINKYAWMWGIPSSHHYVIGEPRKVKVDWYERTMLPIKNIDFSIEEGVYLKSLAVCLKRKSNMKIKLLGHFRGGEDEKTKS